MSDFSQIDANQKEAIINQAMKKALEQDSPDEAITKFIEEVGVHFNCDRIMVFEDNGIVEKPYIFAWEREDLASEMELVNSFSRQEFDWMYKILERDSFIYVEDREKIKNLHPDVYEILVTQNINSICIIPLTLKGKLIGFYYIENPPKIELLHAYDFLEFFGSFLISLLKFRKIFMDLENTSQRDLMTQLYNRMTGKQKIQEMLLAGIDGMFLMMDGDHFKSVNDTFGHAAGDQVILALSDSLHKIFDSIGIPLRLGGDEFAVFVPTFVTEKDASYIIDELVKKISQIDIPSLNGRKITASIGVAFKKNGEAISLEELYRRADIALYKSKAENGNKVTFYSENL